MWEGGWFFLWVELVAWFIWLSWGLTWPGQKIVWPQSSIGQNFCVLMVLNVKYGQDSELKDLYLKQ